MKVLRRLTIRSPMHERHLCFTEESELDYGIYSTFGCYGIYSTIGCYRTPPWPLGDGVMASLLSLGMAK